MKRTIKSPAQEISVSQMAQFREALAEARQARLTKKRDAAGRLSAAKCKKESHSTERDKR